MRKGQVSSSRNKKWDIKSNTAEVYKGTEDIMYNLMQINLKFYFSRSITKNIKQKNE